MRYIVDNDLHIHSKASACSGHPEQTTERILSYAEENGLKTICVTNHFWDDSVKGASDWYAPQNYEHISVEKPLPEKEGIKFLFGCETELDKFLNIGISKEKFDLFDFIIIPTTHFHMTGFTLSEEETMNAERRAKAWVKRLDAVLKMDIPFEKIGIAHLTCPLIAPSREEYLETISLIPEAEMRRLFTKAKEKGVGIELNRADLDISDEKETDIIYRPYKVAKECGCKFYFGSDAHKPEELDIAKNIFEKAVDVLGLTEDDKFIIKGC